LYDGDGLRFSRQQGASPVVRYVSDVASALPTTIGDGTRKYVYGLGLAYAVSGSTVEVFHADRLGTVRAITDAGGAIIATSRFDEWGLESASSGSSSQPFEFAGESRDPTGLSYLRARYYDAGIGRFTSRDTWSGSPTSPQSLNRYTYAPSPPTVTDPSGHSPGDPMAVQGAFPSNHCASLFGDRQRAAEEIAQRIYELQTDPLGLRGNHMYIPHPKYGSVQGHVDQIAQKQSNLANIEARYNRDCSGGPPLPPVSSSVMAPVPMPSAGPVSTVNPLEAARNGIVAGGAVYVTYRVIRFLPSLFPPLWPTAPANALIP
jgi:RHS repeat-associated protein